MPQSEFYVHNLGRAFPFVDHEEEELYPIITDCRITLRPGSGYAHGVNRVFLHRIGFLDEDQANWLGVSAGSFVSFRFDADPIEEKVAVAAFGDASRFEEIPVLVFRKQEFEDVVDKLATESLKPDTSELVEGWVALGDIADALPDVEESEIYLEPTCVFLNPEQVVGQAQTFVYNEITTQFNPPLGCEHVENIINIGDPFQLVCGPLFGEVKLKGGTQVSVDQISTSNQLIIRADGGPGEGGRPCGSIPVDGEVSDEDTAPRCNDVLRSLNGVSGPRIDISSFTGVSVQPHPELNRIVVDIGGKDVSSCTSAEDAKKTDYLPTNDAGINCGDNNQPAPEQGEPDSDTGFDVEIIVGPGTTTPPPGGSPSGCIWRANGADWTLVDYPCQSPNACSSPDRAPLSADEVIRSPCVPYVDPDGEVIRNGDFTADYPLSAWDVTGEVEVINTHPVITQLPIAEFSGGPTRSSLTQREIAVVDGLYVLQAEVYLPFGAGSFNFKLIDTINDVTILDEDYVTRARDVLPLVLGPFRIDDTILDFIVTYTAESGQKANAGIFALTRQ